VKLFFKDLLNAPNAISLSRVVLAPILALFWLGFEWYSAGLVLGTVIGITDLLDGLVARKLNKITELGSLIDQLGDLVFESTCLIIASMSGELWVGLLIIYLFREFSVMVIRSYMLSKGGELPSGTVGKGKSSFLQWAFFFFFFGVILLQPGFLPESWSMVGVPPGRMLIWVAKASIMIGIALGLISGWTYLKGFARFYSKRREA
jgi:cardiolipin synthase